MKRTVVLLTLMLMAIAMTVTVTGAAPVTTEVCELETTLVDQEVSYVSKECSPAELTSCEYTEVMRGGLEVPCVLKACIQRPEETCRYNHEAREILKIFDSEAGLNRKRPAIT